MDHAKHDALVDIHNFSTEFKIQKFKESPVPVIEYTIRGTMGDGVCLSVQGNGILPKNEDYVIFRIRKLDGKSDKSCHRLVICTCMVYVLDVKGEKRFLRTIEFLFRTNDSRNLAAHLNSHVEERYVERNSILNNESEYLQKDTLTIIVEGAVVEKFDRDPVPFSWGPTLSFLNFRVNQCEKNLEVYLCKDSIHVNALMRHSKVFRDMWDAPMQESKERCVLIRNEELPAFLCMLFFIETGRVILHEATIFDLYKIAHMYDIQLVLEKCRENIEKLLPKNLSAILEFATFYNDIELKGIVESFLEKHPHETYKDNSNFGIENNLNVDFICDTRPVCSNIIKSGKDFKKYLKELRKRQRNFNHISSLHLFYIHDPFYIQISEEEEEFRESFDFYK